MPPLPQLAQLAVVALAVGWAVYRVASEVRRLVGQNNDDSSASCGGCSGCDEPSKQEQSGAIAQIGVPIHPPTIAGDGDR